jgi:hypothetical protein
LHETDLQMSGGIDFGFCPQDIFAQAGDRGVDHRRW